MYKKEKNYVSQKNNDKLNVYSYVYDSYIMYSLTAVFQR